MSQGILDVAKEITLAAIDKGLIYRVNGNDRSTAEELNQLNAEEVGKYFKTIAKNVKEAYNGKFDINE